MNKLKNRTRSALAVAVAMAAFVASAVEKIELLDVHQEGATRGTLSYTYKTSNLDPKQSYQLKTVVTARLAGTSGSRTEKTKTLTETLSSTDGTATKTVNLTSTFGSGTFVDCEVLLSVDCVAEDVPPGTIFDYAGEDAPDGYFICNGREVSRTTYKDLFAVIGTTYGVGDSKTTFNLPNLSGRVMQGSNAKYAVGALVPAGLPNLSGSFSRLVSPSYTIDGVLFTYCNFGYSSESHGSGYASGIDFNASRYNPIYGKSDTVQPEAIVFNRIIKY